MKKPEFYLIILIGMLPVLSFAQRKPIAQSFDKGNIVLDLHTSFLQIGREAQFDTRRPIFLGAEVGVRSDVGVGVFGGWSQADYKNEGMPLLTSDFYYYALKLNVHLVRFINKQFKLRINEYQYDIYANAFLGQQLERIRDVSTIGNTTSNSAFIKGGMLGLRVYTKKNIGGFAELGYGAYGNLNLGVCYMF
jgi:hypothetical protein